MDLSRRVKAYEARSMAGGITYHLPGHTCPVSTAIVRHRQLIRCPAGKAQAKNLGIIPYGVFGAPSVECIDLFRDGHYYGCISLIQAVTEAIVRLIWQVKCDKKNTSEGKFKDNLDSLHKRGFIKDQLKATIDTIWEGRNSFHHLKLDLENDHRALEQLAAEKLQLLARVEEHFFGYTIHEGRLKPKYPEYWNVNESGEVLVYMRSRI